MQAAPDPAWIPIPEFRRDDATTVSVFAVAQNAILYLDPVYDPLFSASGALTITVGDVTFYTPDRVFNVLGCIEQHQFCNPNNKGCSDLTILEKAYEQSMEALELNNDQKAALNRTALV